MRYFILLALCYIVVPASAQDSLAPPASRWLTAVGIGFDLRGDQSLNGTGDRISGNTARNLFLTQHYRINRFVDVGFRLGHQQAFQSGARSVIDVTSGLVAELNWRSIQRNIGAGIQPRFNYRIGQGDLGLAVTGGVTWHQNTVLFSGPSLGRATQVSEPLEAIFQEGEISYTYWPTVHFGIALSVSYVAIQLKQSEQNVSSEGEYLFNSIDFIDRTDAIDSRQLAFRVRDQKSYFLNLAIVHHW